MSLCQPQRGNVSCVACCGILNLALSRDKIFQLLDERTAQLKNTASNHPSWFSYRMSREEQEKELPRMNEEIYCCPFLGYINADGKTGCMIHPEQTGIQDSQNASFYGASICRNYQCSNCQTLPHYWQELFVELAQDWVEYTMMAGDHLFRKALASRYLTGSQEDFFQSKELLQAAYQGRFLRGKIHPVTSFET